MNKQVLLPILVAFLILGGVGFYLWQKFGGGTAGGGISTSSLTSMLGGSSSSLPTGTLRDGSLFPSLSENVMLAAVIEPRNFEALAEHFSKVRAKFQNTTLWKKLGLDAMVEQYMDTSLSEVAGEALGAEGVGVSAPPLSPNQIIALITEEWSRLDEVLISLDGTNFSPFPGLEVPRIMLAATFKDEPSRERVQQLAISSLLAGQNEITHDGVTFRKVDDSRITFFLSGPDLNDSEMGSADFGDSDMGASDMGSSEMGEAPSDATGMQMEGGGAADGGDAGLSGGLEFVGKTAYLSIGSDTYRSFFGSAYGGTASGPALEESPRWKTIQTGTVQHPAAFMYYDVARFMQFLEKTSELAFMIPGAPTDGMGAMQASPFSMANFKDFDVVTTSLHVSDGIGARQCAGFKPNSELAATLGALASRAEDDSFTRMLKLVDQNTLVAFNLSGKFVQAYSASARAVRMSASNQQGAQDGAADQSEDWQQYQKTIEALGKLYSRRALKNVGILVNGPRPEQMASLMGPQGSGPTPEFGLLFEFENATSAKELADMLNSTAVLLAGDTGLIELPVATLGKGKPLPDGSLPFAEIVRIKLGDATELIGASVASHSLLIARDEVTLDSMQRRLDSATPLITNESLANRGVDSSLPRSDFYLVISTAPLVELARGFAPMGLLMVPPDMQVGMPEVDEILKLINVQLLTFQNSVKVSDDILCNELRAVAL